MSGTWLRKDFLPFCEVGRRLRSWGPWRMHQSKVTQGWDKNYHSRKLLLAHSGCTMLETMNTSFEMRKLNNGTVDVVSFFQEAEEDWHSSSVTSLVTLGKPPHPWAPQFPYLEKGIIKPSVPQCGITIMRRVEAGKWLAFIDRLTCTRHSAKHFTYVSSFA